jgi:hypothetical protein
VELIHRAAVQGNTDVDAALGPSTAENSNFYLARNPRRLSIHNASTNFLTVLQPTVGRETRKQIDCGQTHLEKREATTPAVSISSRLCRAASLPISKGSVF